jgi:mannan endo-1,4-beta-mannosidase
MQAHTLIKKTALLTAAIAATAAMQASANFSIKNGLILDAYNKPFVMRGVNHAHTWYEDKTQQALIDIAATKANAVRIVLSNGKHTEGWGKDSAAQITAIIQQMKDLKMVAVLEVHDATGYPEKAGASHMASAIDYWIEMKDVLVGQEDYVIINLANEPFGNTATEANWVDAHLDGIKRLRAAGFTHTLMVDGANWGQDNLNVMANNAPKVFAADPLANTVFSVHMYAVYAARYTIDTYLKKFVFDYKLPIVVGEFGNAHGGTAVDYKSIVELANQYNVGYLAWSWSGNSGGDEGLDMALNFNPATLSDWGSFIVNSTYGIKATSQTASVFNGGKGVVFAPKANPVTQTTLANTAATVTFKGVDIDGSIASYSVSKAPAHGSVSGTALAKTYSPAADYSGVDLFNYTATDNEGNVSNDATAEVVVATAGGAGGKPACSVKYVPVEIWDKGAHIQLVVTNNQATAIKGFDLTWNIGASESLDTGYNATSFSSANGKITAHLDASHWNATVAANGGSVTIDYQIKKEQGPAVQATYYTLNSLTCVDSSFTGTGSTTSSAASATPASSTPASSKPASSTPASSKPASATPASSTPASSTPASSKPASSMPASSKPASSIPASSKPASSTPVSSKPASSTPASATPASSVPASSKPTSSTPTSSKPASSLAASSKAASSVASGKCVYVVSSEWSTGFTGAIRITNSGTTAINGWTVTWAYADGSKMTSSWNATVTGSGPYSATNLSWNSTIAAGQTVEFGLQGTKGTSITAQLPGVTGSVCQ